MTKARLWLEAVLAVVSAVLTVVTAIWPDWIEILFDESPDHGDGSVERLFALGWLAATVLFSLLARRDYRRLRTA